MSDAIDRLVGLAMSITPATMTECTRRRARWAVVDTIAAALAGADADGVGAVRAQLLHWGGRAEATTVGWADRVPAPAAAWLNAMMGRALDFDDCDDETGDHPSAATVSAALAAAEMAGTDDAASVLAGIVAGTEVVLRLRRATDERLNPDLPWTAGTYAPMAAAVAAAKVRGLEHEEMRNALGLAFTEMSNTIQSQRDRTLAHRVHHGSAVASGLVAVELAARGITGVRNVLEGPYGVFRSFMNGRGTAERLLAATEGGSMLDDVSIKPYPSCRFTHGPIEGALTLTGGEALAERRVGGVRVRVGRAGMDLCGAPWQRGGSSVAAQFNLRYVVATALLRGRVSLAHFDMPHLSSEEVAALATRIGVDYDPALDVPGTQVGPTAISLEVDGGRVESLDVPHPYGHPRNPISEEDFVHKVRDCVATARRGGAPSPAMSAMTDFLRGEDPGVLHLLSATAINIDQEVEHQTTG